MVAFQDANQMLAIWRFIPLFSRRAAISLSSAGKWRTHLRRRRLYEYWEHRAEQLHDQLERREYMYTWHNYIEKMLILKVGNTLAWFSEGNWLLRTCPICLYKRWQH